MTFLLRMKAWKLFTIMMLPYGLWIITVIAGFATSFATEGTDQDEMLYEAIIFGAFTMIALIVSAFLMLAWTYNVATRLYTKLPAEHNLKVGRFKFAFFFPMVYFVAVIGVVYLVIQTEAATMLFAILPFHIFAILCMLYVIRYIAKSLRSVELQRPVKFGDYAGEFCLMWFFFIGVWIIQPRINTIFAGEQQSNYGGPVDRYLK